MKLVAIIDLANVPKIGITVNPKSKGYKHPLHIHKGYRFDFGSSDSFDKLTAEEKEVVSILVTSKGVVVDDGSQSSNVAITKVDAEIAEEKAREKRDGQRIHQEQNRWTIDRRLALYAIIVAILALAAYLIFR